MFYGYLRRMKMNKIIKETKLDFGDQNEADKKFLSVEVFKYDDDTGDYQVTIYNDDDVEFEKDFESKEDAMKVFDEIIGATLITWKEIELLDEAEDE
jgi:hypothetical protein